MAQTKPTPFRFSPELDQQMEQLSKHLGKSKQETMRICMELGAQWIEQNGYDPSVEIKAQPLVRTLVEVVAKLSAQLVTEAAAKPPAVKRRP